jgi:hypothetical protein
MSGASPGYPTIVTPENVLPEGYSPRFRAPSKEAVAAPRGLTQAEVVKSLTTAMEYSDVRSLEESQRDLKQKKREEREMSEVHGMPDAAESFSAKTSRDKEANDQDSQDSSYEKEKVDNSNNVGKADHDCKKTHFSGFLSFFEIYKICIPFVLVFVLLTLGH